MPILKAPPKLIRNATIQVRVEEEVDLKLRKYAEYIGSTPAFVVSESLKLLFHKDAEFREWFAHHDGVPDPSKDEELTKKDESHTSRGNETLFSNETRRTANK
jgi:hypothetical protein